MDQRRPLPDDTLDAAADAFQRLRTRLFGMTYRVLGSVSDAEDMVQDVWVRRQDTDRARCWTRARSWRRSETGRADLAGRAINANRAHG
jgi:DNA-directed RNA polymerase specialized sigma24 family protein